MPGPIFVYVYAILALLSAPLELPKAFIVPVKVSRESAFSSNFNNVYSFGVVDPPNDLFESSK